MVEVYIGNSSDIEWLCLDGVSRRLTQHPANDVHASFTPDGQSVLFASDRGGTWQLWRQSLDGDTEPLQVTAGEAHFGKQLANGDLCLLGCRLQN